jgi:L-2-hydroxyglutarate oxidase LhgO
MDRLDCVVIGAGVVGLAVARALALAGRDVVVLERHLRIGAETSSRNSEVIHAGLYYPPGSLKATLCVEGRDALYTYCEQRAIPHRRCGKLVVATSEAQLPALYAIQAQAHANGCTEVARLSAREACAAEPALNCLAALSSPNTGIVDSHSLMLALQGDAENAGALFALGSEVVNARIFPQGIVLQVRASDGSEAEVECTSVVNCGGLWATHIAQRITGLNRTSVPTPWFAKGSYYSLAGKSPFSRLVYPVPEPGGLGVHLTLDLGGQARFGPDVEWLDNTHEEPDYTVDPRRAERFYREIRAYWPDLPDHSLQPAYSGVRPKISGPQQAAADFLFAQHDCANYLGLYGIESPGLTAALAIGEQVRKVLGRRATQVW